MREGWPFLIAVQLKVAANKIVYFKAPIFHCGWEYVAEDPSPSFRYHVYFQAPEHTENTTICPHFFPALPYGEVRGLDTSCSTILRMVQLNSLMMA